MQVVIFNSGLGKRMGEATKATHKAMVPLVGHGGETIFERQIRLLVEAGLKDFVITTGPFKDQIESVFDKPEYKNLKVAFVENPLYATTNYIYSFYLARDYINDDALVLHGDLVFNRDFLQKMLDAPEGSWAAVDKAASQPEKDFKVRVKDGLVKEVRIDIFDKDCYAFQPFYRLRAADMQAWIDEIVRFVEADDTGVYAENALNTITDRVAIQELSYRDDFVAEIDTLEDLSSVSAAISQFD
ncbi:MAG: NTP transferase domain-containing protein [Coriobacteriia bacterium]|nr:NTP transferase domain-containing protein [Coriobacteriia bacterium]